MLKISAGIFLIILNVFIALGHPFPGHKGKKKETAVSYAIMTKHEHKAHHTGHKDYKGYPDLHDPKHKHYETTHEEHNGPAKYNFSYGVKDPKTGDIKKQWESRDGDKVKGGYSFKEADGTTRLVHYSADKHKGFEAIVKNIAKSKKQGKGKGKKKELHQNNKGTANSFLIYAGH